MQAGIVPAALEMIDRVTIAAVEPVLHTGFPLDADAVLLVEVDGSPAQVEAEGEIVQNILRSYDPREVRTAADPADREALWAGRKGAISALGHIRPNYYLLDGVVPRTRLPDVLDTVYQIAARYDLPVANVFHAGDGNLHPCLLFDEREEGATAKVLDAGGEIMRACVDAGGAISGGARRRPGKALLPPLDLLPGRHRRDAATPPRLRCPRRLQPLQDLPPAATAAARATPARSSARWPSSAPTPMSDPHA